MLLFPSIIVTMKKLQNIQILHRLKKWSDANRFINTVKKRTKQVVSYPHFMLILILVITGAIYLYTMPPSILWIDSGTMIAASKTLGIPNPPGFPFYMMVSHLFSIIPIFNVLTRLELFTVTFSVILIGILYQLIILIISTFMLKKAEDVKKHKLAISLSAFFASISLAFSYQYWSQSENTEAFIFTYCFGTLFLFLIFRLLKQTLPILEKKDALYQKKKMMN